MMPFSVAVTDASSSRMSPPCRPPIGAQLELAVVAQVRAQCVQHLQVRVDAPPANVVAAGRSVYHESGRGAPAAAP